MTPAAIAEAVHALRWMPAIIAAFIGSAWASNALFQWVTA